MNKQVQVVVAGHICLDIIPALEGISGGLGTILVPGSLLNVGPATTATGGAVSNTGLALHRLGISTRLMGKIGDDRFGSATLEILRERDGALAEGMIVTPGEHTSYTIVISPPGVDRVFLHCPGANDTFGADDVALEHLRGVRLFHFGYPPIMRRMFIDGGEELEKLLRVVKKAGLTVSLDMAKPDPASEAGRVDWPALLSKVLPCVDVFGPSLDEILFMLDRTRFDLMSQQADDGDITPLVDGRLLGEISQRLIDLGAAVVVLKLGSAGLYARTTSDSSRLAAAGAAAPNDTDKWAGRELLAPCFKVDVAGTTGSGDCTIAGFLAGLLHGLDLEGAMTMAVAVGACNVERPDATSGVRPWEQIRKRIASDWQRHKVPLNLTGWRADTNEGVFIGPNDKVAK
ncbi:MAG: carbohydrate kinase family protein [Planctomycetota bacterium]|nr:carbohydrate kinase family protein [Planctomycetota bacterium]